ncbi:hypothetical protein OIDMADRAFT_21209 [Oidiodendron maius Zn]|uniref:Uncharacterized protein n=1 Tax=Oidiodendron maius (strain Zn) TaxID=913774 RepID=A0A0C3GX64_OIDMZ|nr:hypothetical protein OIDMADRAFT_21209 [Oidiodendron maius Zn]
MERFWCSVHGDFTTGARAEGVLSRSARRKYRAVRKSYPPSRGGPSVDVEGASGSLSP